METTLVSDSELKSLTATDSSFFGFDIGSFYNGTAWTGRHATEREIPPLVASNERMPANNQSLYEKIQAMIYATGRSSTPGDVRPNVIPPDVYNKTVVITLLSGCLAVSIYYFVKGR